MAPFGILADLCFKGKCELYVLKITMRALGRRIRLNRVARKRSGRRTYFAKSLTGQSTSSLLVSWYHGTVRTTSFLSSRFYLQLTRLPEMMSYWLELLYRTSTVPGTVGYALLHGVRTHSSRAEHGRRSEMMSMSVLSVPISDASSMQEGATSKRFRCFFHPRSKVRHQNAALLYSCLVIVLYLVNTE